MPVRILETLGELETVRRDWDRLAAGRPPMDQFAWMRACAESFAGERRLRVFVLERGGRARAIAPLVARRRGRLELIGVSDLYEPTDFIHEDRACAEELAAVLSDCGKGLDLKRLPARSPSVAALRKAYRRHGYLRVKPTHAFPSLALDESWSDPERHFSSKRRSDFRRARRHAQKEGEIRFETLAPRPGDLPRLLDEAFVVEAAGWKGERGSALAKDSRRGSFFRRYAQLSSEQGMLRLAFMRIGEVPVAMHYFVECGGRSWLLKIGYDERFARCSPGTLLMLHAIADAARRGLSSFEFLGCREGWTDLWTHALTPCVAVRAYPFSPSGLFAFGRDVLQFTSAHLP